MSTPWFGREFEQERRPTVRPWNAPLKLRMEIVDHMAGESDDVDDHDVDDHEFDDHDEHGEC